MADPSVQKLRDAFANAPAGPVVLNDAFWTGRPDAAADFAAAIKQRSGCRRSRRGSKSNTTAHGDAGDRRYIPNPRVALAFLTAPPANTTATIYGSPGTAATPVLGVDVVPATGSFPISSRRWRLAFTLLQIVQQRFFFTTAAQSFTWSDQNATMKMRRGRIFTALRPCRLRFARYCN